MLNFARLAVLVAIQAQAPDSRWTLSYRDKSTNDCSTGTHSRIPQPSPSPFIGEWKLDPSRSRLPDEMKVQRKIGNTYVFDFGGGPETISVDGTDQPGLDATLLSVKAKGPRTWMVQR